MVSNPLVEQEQRELGSLSSPYILEEVVGPRPTPPYLHLAVHLNSAAFNNNTRQDGGSRNPQVYNIYVPAFAQTCRNPWSLGCRIPGRFNIFLVKWLNRLQIYMICLQTWQTLSVNVASSWNSRLQNCGGFCKPALASVKCLSAYPLQREGLRKLPLILPLIIRRFL